MRIGTELLEVCRALSFLQFSVMKWGAKRILSLVLSSLFRLTRLLRRSSSCKTAVGCECAHSQRRGGQRFHLLSSRRVAWGEAAQKVLHGSSSHFFRVFFEVTVYTHPKVVSQAVVKSELHRFERKFLIKPTGRSFFHSRSTEHTWWKVRARGLVVGRARTGHMLVSCSHSGWRE